MKKGIIVLLIAVLVSGFAFAKFEGNAKITFGADLDKKTFGFDNLATGKYTFEFTYDTLAASKDAHETELWAEIAAEGSVKLSTEVKFTDKDVHKDDPKATADKGVTATFTITKANIHVKDFTFGILNMGTGPDYAKSYYLKADGKTPEYDVLAGPDKYVPGFTVEYKDYKAGFGITGDWKSDKVKVETAGWMETKAFKFGENEEFSAQAGAYAVYTSQALIGGSGKFAGVALKGGYAAEKLAANVATDMQIIRVAGKNIFAFEAAADATYTINANGSAGVNVYSVFDKANIFPTPYNKEVMLDAKVWAKYNFDFNGTKLATEAHVDVRDILADERTFEVYAKETLTILEEKLALEFSEKYGYMKVTVFDEFKIEAYAFQFTAKATYTAEKFTATAAIDDLTIGKLTIAGDSVTAMILKASCGISSTAIIENAEIGAKYKDFGFYKIFVSGLDDSSEIAKGAIEVYAKISF